MKATLYMLMLFIAMLGFWELPLQAVTLTFGQMEELFSQAAKNQVLKQLKMIIYLLEKFLIVLGKVRQS